MYDSVEEYKKLLRTICEKTEPTIRIEVDKSVFLDVYDAKTQATLDILHRLLQYEELFKKNVAG